jgi:hypothetical protein
MKRVLHLISCYLPNNAFVDAFFGAMASELHRQGQEMLLLPTYTPQTDALQYVQISYTLAGYAQLARPVTGVDSGLVPAALADAEAAWTRRSVDAAAHAGAVATCSRFFGLLLDEMEPDTVSIWNPTVPQGRLLQMACLARAIPCFGIERGVFAETMMVESREVGAQADVALNPALRSVLAERRPDPERLAEIRDYYAQRDFSRYPMAPSVSAAALKDDLGVPAAARTVVLMLSVAAANWTPRSLPGARFTSPWFASAQQSVTELLAALPDDAYLIVQDHPLDRGHWRPTPHPRLRHVRGAHLRTLFDAADLLAFLGATTVQHEALLTEKPLLLLSRSQLTGQGVAYEYSGRNLPVLVERALRHDGHQAQSEAAARYVPFLFDHALFGLPGTPPRRTAADLALHLAALESAHSLDTASRIERWLATAAANLAAAEPLTPRPAESVT